MHDRRESDIVLSARNGNRQAFGELVERYQNMVTSMAFSKTGDLQRSEDIAQQSFLIAWKKLAELQDADRFGGWLRSITRNVVLNSNRKSRRLDRSAQSIESYQEPTTFESPDDALSSREQQELLWRSLKNIPEEYREPLILFYREDKSVKEVAFQMGLSVDAVKQRLSRGRALLKGEVEQFVENLLGSTKPSASFSSAVLALLPAASASAVGQVAMKGSSVFGVKMILGKLGLLASGPFLGIMGGMGGALMGVAGAWYGTKKAVDNATSQEEQDLIWRLFRTMIVLTTLEVAAIVAAVFLASDPMIPIWIIGLTIVYTLVLIVLTIQFNAKQSLLHSQHGKPDYLKQYENIKLATPNQIRFSTLGSTVGCWLWLIVIAAIDAQWLLLGAAAIAMIGHSIWRWVSISVDQDGFEVMRLHANMALVNGILIASVILVTGFAGVSLSWLSIPNFAFAMIPLLIGGLIGGIMWHAAERMELRKTISDSSAS